MKRLLSLLAVLMTLLVAGAAVETLDGTYQYAANYKVLLDYDGYYYGEINKFSDLSAEDGVVTYLYIVEKPGLAVTWVANFTIQNPYGTLTNLTQGETYDTTQEQGNINATVAYQYANGTSTSVTYGHFYNYTINPEPLDFFVQLRRGDTALVTIYKPEAATNITRLQVVKLISNVEIVKRISPTLDTLADGFGSIVAIEVGLFELVKNIAQLAYYAFMVLVAPVLLVLMVMWAFRKIKEAVLR